MEYGLSFQKIRRELLPPSHMGHMNSEKSEEEWKKHIFHQLVLSHDVTCEYMKWVASGDSEFDKFVENLNLDVSYQLFILKCIKIQILTLLSSL